MPLPRPVAAAGAAAAAARPPPIGPKLPKAPDEALEGVADLAGHDPELVGVALGDLREHLEVLVGEELLVRVAGVDGLEDRTDGLGLALGAQGGGLGLTLGAQDRGLLLALGGEDRGLPDAFGGEDRGALVTVGAHLLLHRVLDGGRAARWP